MSKVMVVDDEESITSLFRMALEKEGYQVIDVTSGEECLKRLERENPDLVLLDIMMPGMSGMQVLEEIRKVAPDTASIVVTAHASLDSAISAVRYGANGYITKPFNINEVIIAVRRALKERELELRLRKSEEKYRHLFENASDSIFLISPHGGRFLEMNKKTGGLTGYAKDELLGRRFKDICHSEEINRIIERFNEHVEEGAVVFDDAPFVKKDGGTAWVDISAGLVEYGDEKAILTIVRDITERKKAQEEIKKLKEFNEEIVQSLQEGVLMEDSEGRVSFANPRMVEMLGYSKDELLGMHWSSFVAPDYRKNVEKETMKRPEGVKSRYEAVLVSKSGREIPVVISATPVFENSDFKGVLAVITDISDIKRGDEERIQKMMRYRVERGNAYLLKEKKLEKGKEVFLDLLNCGFKGLIITRTSPIKVKEMCGAEVPVVWLSEKRYDKMTIPPNFFLIETTIENYLDRNRAVLLDRLDYLILKNGFEKTMEFIQRLSELFFINKGILILSLDPEILSENELMLLEKEAAEVKPKHEPEFPEDLYEILEFVHGENKVGKKPAHKDVEKKFKITRTTARKRINRLKHLGLIEDSKWGKYKVLKLTENGRAYF